MLQKNRITVPPDSTKKWPKVAIRESWIGLGSNELVSVSLTTPMPPWVSPWDRDSSVEQSSRDEEWMTELKSVDWRVKKTWSVNCVKTVKWTHPLASRASFRWARQRRRRRRPLRHRPTRTRRRPLLLRHDSDPHSTTAPRATPAAPSGPRTPDLKQWSFLQQMFDSDVQTDTRDTNSSDDPE